MTIQELSTIQVYKAVYNRMNTDTPYITVIYSDAKSINDDEDVIVRAKLFWDSNSELWRIYSVSALGDGLPVVRDYTQRVHAIASWESFIRMMDSKFDTFSAGLFV